MLTFSEEPFSSVENNQHLIVEHWEEVSDTYFKMSLDIDWNMYHILEKAGMLTTIVARAGDLVVGYAVFLIQYNLNSKATLMALNNGLFLSKEYRGHGRKMIRECQRLLEDKYKKIHIVFHVRPQADFSKILEADGYKKFETMYCLPVGA